MNNGVFHKLDVIGFKELSVVFITNNTVDGDAEAFRESRRYDYVFTNISSIEQMVVSMETIKIQGDSIKKWCVSGHANGSITGAFFLDKTAIDINQFTQEQINRANNCLAPNATYASFGCYVGTNEIGLSNMVSSFSNLSSASGYTGKVSPGDGVILWLNIILDWYDGRHRWFTTKFAE